MMGDRRLLENGSRRLQLYHRKRFQRTVVLLLLLVVVMTMTMMMAVTVDHTGTVVVVVVGVVAPVRALR